jgi:hypothetical protein
MARFPGIGEVCWHVCRWENTVVRSNLASDVLERAGHGGVAGYHGDEVVSEESVGNWGWLIGLPRW